MNKDQLRLWHVTVGWKRRGQHLKKEFIISASDKEEAIQQAQNRIAMPLNKPDQLTARARDLGAPLNHRTYYSSDVLQTGIRAQEDPATKLFLHFALAWGSEIGWRATNQAASPTDQIYLSKLKQETDALRLLNEWAKACLETGADDPDLFFREQLAAYLGTTIVSTEDMIPVSDNEYDRLMKKAHMRAQQIIDEAQASADEIRTQLATETANLARIAQALTGQPTSQPVQSVPSELNQSIEPEPAETQPVPEDQADLEAQITIQEQPADEAARGDEISDDTLAEAQAAASLEDTQPVSDPDVPSEHQDLPPAQPVSDADLMDAFPDDPDDEEPEAPEEEIPEEDLLPPDFPPDFPPENFEPDDDTENDPDRLPETAPETSALTDEILMDALHSFKSEALLQVLTHLKFLAVRKTTGTRKELPGDQAFQRLFETKSLNETDRARAMAKMISMCQPINGLSPLRYAYNCCTIAMDEDTAIE